MRTIIRNNYTPQLGDYHERIVIDEELGKRWLFDCDGVFMPFNEVNVVNEFGDSTTDAISQKFFTDTVDDINGDILGEREARIDADGVLQAEIDAIKNSPDVVDIVPTYAALQAYDTSSLGTDDIVRVLRDENHDGASTYYRWNDPNTGWNFIGTVGDYYTTGQVDTLLAGKQDTLTAGENITINNNVISATGGQSDWAENDSTNPAYIKNRTHYTEAVETTTEQYGSTSAGTTPDTGYVWFIEKVESYALSDILNAETGDSVYVNITYSVNGTERTDGAKFTATVEDNNLSLDSDAEPGNRWRGAYASELDGDTTFRWPVAAADSSATVYITKVDYEVVKQLDAKYIPVDGNTVKINADGKLEADVQGGPTVVQTTGTSTTDVMSQNATTSMIYADPGVRRRIKIGQAASSNADYATAIGFNAGAYSNGTISIGHNSIASAYGSIAIGDGATNSSALGAISLGAYSGGNITAAGMIDVGASQTNVGYNTSNYRLLTGLYDPQNAHDAATKGYVDTAVAGAGITVLTTADYNYPASNPNCVALWLLEPGMYMVGEQILFRPSGANLTVLYANTILIVSRAGLNDYATVGLWGSDADSYEWDSIRVRTADGSVRVPVSSLPTGVINNLTTTSATIALSANQGKVLNDKIGGDLTNLVTTDKTSLINAINEVAGQSGGGASEINATDWSALWQ